MRERLQNAGRQLSPATKRTRSQIRREILRAVLLGVLLAATAAVAAERKGATPWVVAAGVADVDGDGVPDRIRVETAHPTFIADDEPCSGCGDRVEGEFAAVVVLSKSKRAVRTPVALHTPGETLWFWRKPTSVLVIADYNGDGRPDFNLGCYVNSVKWEYGLFSIGADGRVARLAKDAPEIYVAPGEDASTDRIEVIPGGFRFHDFGNAGESPGWWTFTCHWQRADTKFACDGGPDAAAGGPTPH